MTTKISNVTTKMKVVETINGFKFDAIVEVYNNQKVIKSLNATVTKEGEVVPDPVNPMPAAGPRWYYSVSRGVYENNMGCGSINLPEGTEGEEMLSAGILFEQAVDRVINSSEFNNI